MGQDFLKIARSVSGYQSADIARIIGLDPCTYRQLERHPDRMNLHMIELILPNLNRYSVRIVHDAVDDIFLPFE